MRKRLITLMNRLRFRINTDDKDSRLILKSLIRVAVAESPIPPLKIPWSYS